MTDNLQRQKGQGRVVSALNMAITSLTIVKEATSATPANPVVGSVANLLTMIRDTMANEQDYVDLGLSCADICKALERGMDGKSLSDLSKSVCDAINQLAATVAEIRGKVLKRSERHGVSRFLHSRDDKDAIAAWKSELNRILHVFNTELAMNTHTIVADIHQGMSKLREGAGNEGRANSVLGQLPPPPPRSFFGRDELIEKVVHLAKGLTPIALIGAGGIGKTSIVLTVLHHDRIKQRFGENRRFVCCDGFPATQNHFLRQLSKAIGAGIENPEDLAPLRPFLSSKEMLLVLDNAESILDPRVPNAQEIYAVVDELIRFNNICVYITSRISNVPPHCEIVKVPKLSTAAAQDTFYRIYKHSRQSNQVNDILAQLDFHPLSITLLATVAQQNGWDANRLAMGWARRRTAVLDTQQSKSLATTIELSLSSPTFRELGPAARSLLEVVAFLPQGINEKNTDWLFPTIPGVSNVLDKFCALSLTYRSDGFITMLAPLRDHLCPKDPASSPLLRTTGGNYFIRLSGEVSPGKPGFEEARWITKEDINVEHLLDVFTAIDAGSESIWDVCAKFMAQLDFHKSRLVTLGPKIEALPDNHPSKPQCLLDLSRLFDSVGNFMERKRLLNHSLMLWREQGDDSQAALTLGELSDVNRRMGLREEGIRQAKEASEIFKRFGHLVQQAKCLTNLAWLLCDAGQLDAAEEEGSRAINLLPRKGEEFLVCKAHRVLGYTYRSKGKMKKAVRHLEAALGIASSFNMVEQLFWVNLALAEAFCKEGEFEDAQTHVEHAKSHAVDSVYLLAYGMDQQARIWYRQHRFEEARSEALRALNAFERLGAARNVEIGKRLLQKMDA